MVPSPRLRVEEADQVRVVRLVDRQLMDDRSVREVADALLAVVAAAPAPPRVVLDLAPVESVSSAMLGKLILVQRKVAEAGGRLRLCEIRPQVQSVLRTTNLDRLFAIDRDRREAIEAIGP
jgi:anti-sigma B factor antagonist